MSETNLKGTWSVQGFPFWTVWITVLVISLLEMALRFGGFVDTPLFVRGMIDGGLATLVIIWMLDWWYGQ